jgi:hypothetical protein
MEAVRVQKAVPIFLIRLKAWLRLGRIISLMYDMVIQNGRAGWYWQVCDRSGKIMMHGWEKTRAAAKYRGERALFLLLLKSGLNNTRRTPNA